MDRFFGPHSTEAIAYNSLTENGLTWDSDHSVDEGLLAGCVAYQALNRFLTGADLFILPRSRTELDSIFRRYTYDAIHNMIAKSRSTLQSGGYSRICHLAERSLRTMLNTNDNVSVLLALHTPPSTPSGTTLEELSPRSIKT